ncbi:MAG: phospho-N-acetylmuramoyl-pentapeptide-transferase [Actinobacteria bacterium]|nr:phospho-N-acetylmuramoyl-pentapeptide-transferase [Actinomycetota bacterium]
MGSGLGKIVFAALISGGLSLILSPLWIRYQRYRRMGQKIRIDGPRSHSIKSGTPTMGGLVIIISCVLASLIMGTFSKQAILVLVAYILCGAVGFIDDYISIKKDRSLGLRAGAKFFAQIAVAALFAFFAIEILGLSTSIKVPLTDLSFDIGYFYYLFVFFLLTAATNAVNLTDGLDGLAAGVSAFILSAFIVIAFMEYRHMGVTYGLDLAAISAAMVGASAGFLWFNSAPADIFMGDTGSLSYGAAIATIAIMLKLELLLPIFGGLLVIETASVILQILSFKLFKRRVFKMAPIHHHFELKQWPEFKIIIRFWLICMVFVTLGFLIFYLELI